MKKIRQFKLLIMVLCCTSFAISSHSSISKSFELKCDHVDTNPFIEKKDAPDHSIWFDFDTDRKEISWHLNGSPRIKMEMLTVFWNNDFIGAVHHSNIFSSFTSYLFNRKSGEVVITSVGKLDFDRSTREAMHSITRLNGAIDPLLYKCFRADGF